MSGPPYIDALGREWADYKLDELFADPEVDLTVQAGAGIGLRPDGTWSHSAVLNWARIRYEREEAAVLVLLLVAVYFDAAGREGSR